MVQSDRSTYPPGEAEMKRPSLVREYLRFLKTQKKYWMIPLVVLLLVMGTLVVLLEGSALAPFIYTIF